MALRRWARRLLLAMTILGLIVLAAAAGLPRIVDANRYRPLVSAWAQEATGLSVRLGIIGLLRGRLTFRSIVLNRPTLTLIRDAQGRWNFADLLARASAAS